MMKITKISWDYESAPACKNEDIVVLVQYGQAEIARFVSPKPRGAPDDGGDFIFEMGDIDDKVAEQLFDVIKSQYPEVEKEIDMPFLFHCPAEFAEKVDWD